MVSLHRDVYIYIFIAREAPPWSGTADRDICPHAGIPLRASDSDILVVISGSGSQEPAALRLCARIVHSLV